VYKKSWETSASRMAKSYGIIPMPHTPADNESEPKQQRRRIRFTPVHSVARIHQLVEVHRLVRSMKGSNT
jgi:hypothetical protein